MVNICLRNNTQATTRYHLNLQDTAHILILSLILICVEKCSSIFLRQPMAAVFRFGCFVKESASVSDSHSNLIFEILHLKRRPVLAWCFQLFPHALFQFSTQSNFFHTSTRHAFLRFEFLTKLLPPSLTAATSRQIENI